MRNITIKRDPDNRSRNKLDEQLRSIWLGDWFRSITLDETQEPDTREIRGLLCDSEVI